MRVGLIGGDFLQHVLLPSYLPEETSLLYSNLTFAKKAAAYARGKDIPCHLFSQDPLSAECDLYVILWYGWERDIERLMKRARRQCCRVLVYTFD